MSPYSSDIFLHWTSFCHVICRQMMPKTNINNTSNATTAVVSSSTHTAA
jgi:hypothetical protein